MIAIEASYCVTRAVLEGKHEVQGNVEGSHSGSGKKRVHNLDDLSKKSHLPPINFTKARPAKGNARASVGRRIGRIFFLLGERERTCTCTVIRGVLGYFLENGFGRDS